MLPYQGIRRSAIAVFWRFHSASIAESKRLLSSCGLQNLLRLKPWPQQKKW